MIDWFLTAWLVVIFPAYSGWNSLRSRKPKGSKVRTHLQTILFGLAPLLVLAINWTRQHRAVADLGLGAPITLPALIGLGLSISVILGLGVSSLLSKARPSPTDSKTEAMLRILPQAWAEWPSFIAFCLTVGVAWEVLYRGYLLWVLSPIVGTVGAVAIASIAYGLGHGVKNGKRMLGSLFAATLFTTGYAVTKNLWWLMLIHTGLPLLPAFLALRAPIIDAEN